MFRALHTASSGMDAQQRNIDVTANNIANVNTTGYKAARAQFQELLYQHVESPGSPDNNGAPTGIEVGLGVRTGSTRRAHSQGNLEATENPLDIAIEGAGFFPVVKENGERAYTRAGAMRVDALGRMVTQDGYELDPSVTIPPDAIQVTVNRNGQVLATMPDDPMAVEVGQIELARFANPAGLTSLGRNLYAPTQASGDAILSMPGEDGTGELSQGFLESSNVNVVDEMVGMIVAQRAYEINSKVIRTADEMLRSVTNIR